MTFVSSTQTGVPVPAEYRPCAVVPTAVGPHLVESEKMTAPALAAAVLFVPPAARGTVPQAAAVELDDTGTWLAALGATSAESVAFASDTMYSAAGGAAVPTPNVFEPVAYVTYWSVPVLVSALVCQVV